MSLITRAYGIPVLIHIIIYFAILLPILVNTDYRLPISRDLMFRSGSSRECLDLLILPDQFFELPEDLSADITNVVLDGTSLFGTDQVTVQPSDTLIIIEDTDGEWCVGVCVGMDVCVCVRVCV